MEYWYAYFFVIVIQLVLYLVSVWIGGADPSGEIFNGESAVNINTIQLLQY